MWIGYNAIILPGCTNIGDGAVIGAGSIVTRDVPSYEIYAGNPARFVKKRSVINSEWYQWDLSRIMEEYESGRL